MASSHRRRLLPGSRRGSPTQQPESSEDLDFTASSSPPSTPLTLENVKRLSNSGEEVPPQTVAGNFYTLIRPITPLYALSSAANETSFVGYDSDSSHGSSKKSSSTEPVTAFVFDSDSESERSSNYGEGPVSNDAIAGADDDVDTASAAAASSAAAAAELDATPSLSLSVPRVSPLSGGEIGYVIDVKHSSQLPDLSWTCTRTFAELCEWYADNKLRLRPAAIQAPFPQIDYAASAEAASVGRIEARRAALSAFMQELSTHPDLVQSPAVLTLINPDSSSSSSSSSSGGSSSSRSGSRSSSPVGGGSSGEDRQSTGQGPGSGLRPGPGPGPGPGAIDFRLPVPVLSFMGGADSSGAGVDVDLAEELFSNGDGDGDSLSSDEDFRELICSRLVPRLSPCLALPCLALPCPSSFLPPPSSYPLCLTNTTRPPPPHALHPCPTRQSKRGALR